MIFNKTKIDGVMLIESEPFIDERGAFRRHFCKDEFAKNNIVTDVSQCNVSENKFARTLRGFHYQLQPFSEGKTLSCLNGKIFDIVVDLRTTSLPPTEPDYANQNSMALSDNMRQNMQKKINESLGSGYWNDEEWFASALNGGFAYALFGSLLGLPPFNKLIK